MTYTAVPNTFAGTFTDDVNTLDANFTYLASKLISVRDYGAVGNGTTDDTVAFQAAATALRAAGGGTLRLEPGKTYKLFTGAVAQTFALDVSGCANVWIQGNGASITSGLVNTAQSIVFIYGTPVTGLRVSDLTFIGGNTTLTANSGEGFLAVNAGATNVNVQNCIVKNCNSGVASNDNSSIQSGITVLSCYFEKVFYPLIAYGVFGLTARYRTVNCGRSYFPVAPGANHDVVLYSQSGYTSSDCLLKVYADSAKTVDNNTLSNIRLAYFSSGRVASAGNQGDAIIQMDIEQLTGVSAAGHFENIAISFNIDGAGTSKPGNIFGMDKYLSGGGGGDPTARGHTIRNVTISGVARNWDNSSGGYGISICNTAKGDVWTGDSVTGFAVRDVTILGIPSVSALLANAQAAVSTAPFLTLENFYADGGISYTNATGARISEINVKSSGFDATDVPTTAWTPTDGSGASLVFTGVSATYNKRGRQVTVNLALTYPVTADATAASINGIPFAFAATGWSSINTSSATAKGISLAGSSIALGTGAGGAVTNAQMSGTFVVATFTYLMA